MNNNSTIDRETLAAAMRILNRQQEYANECTSKAGKAEQQAYVDGMRFMLTHILSDYCTKYAGVFYNCDTQKWEVYSHPEKA